MQIADFGDRLRIVPAAGDTSTTIAHLAQFVTFDLEDAKRYDTAAHCIAYDALEAEYGAFEKSSGFSDYYDGMAMTFKDGSMIQVFSV